MRCVTGARPINIIMAREMQSTARLSLLARAASDMQREVRSRHIKERLLECLKLMNIAEGRRLEAPRQRYRKVGNRKVLKEPYVRVSDAVYIDRPYISCIPVQLNQTLFSERV